MMMEMEIDLKVYNCAMCGVEFLDDPDYVADHGYICVDCAETEPLDFDDWED